VLAYLFWHGPPPDATVESYEAALAAFHRTLGQHAPAGFRGSAAFRVDGTTWAGDYEDWYLVEDWSALGELNEAAVTAPRRDPHDAVAGLSAKGAGGVYSLVAGRGEPERARWAVWLHKPRGEPGTDFVSRITPLAGDHGGVWQRQLVLGPGREFCVHAFEEPDDSSLDCLKLPLTQIGREETLPS
jgi:hypothetical protein